MTLVVLENNPLCQCENQHFSGLWLYLLGLVIVEMAIVLAQDLIFLTQKHETHSGFGIAGQYQAFQGYWKTGAVMG